MSDLERELADAGGTAAPASSTARLRELLSSALRDGRAELERPRSGYESPVTVGIGPGLHAVAPVDPAVRADEQSVGERAWLLVAGLVGALVELAGAEAPRGPGDLRLRAGMLDGGFLALHYPGRVEGLDELAPLAFEEQVAHVDRLRARALALPAALVEPTDLREPISHQLRVAEVVARLGGRPADPSAVDALDEAVLAVLEPGGGTHRPHEDPDPVRRVARRILQRLNGMGKWGGYHTEITHLPRGFAGHERELAVRVGEALLSCGLLDEKPSVGQRHVFLNPRRAGDIHRLIETGEPPGDLTLPSV